MSSKRGFTTYWKSISNFFEYGNLVPFGVLISTYHYANALNGFGEHPLIAVAQGVFVDMLHYRSVVAAVQKPNKLRLLTASFTTLIAYGFHVLFYATSHHDSVIASNPISWFVLALAIPFGIMILAWLTEDTSEVKRAVEATIAHLRTHIKELEQSLNSAQDEVIRVQTLFEQRVKELEQSLNIEQESSNSVLTEVAKVRTKFEQRVEELEQSLNIERKSSNSVQTKVAEVRTKFEQRIEELEHSLNIERESSNSVQTEVAEVRTKFEQRVKKLEQSLNSAEERNTHLQRELQKAQAAFGALGEGGQLFVREVLTGEMSQSDFAKLQGHSPSVVSAAKKVLNGVSK